MASDGFYDLFRRIWSWPKLDRGTHRAEPALEALVVAVAEGRDLVAAGVWGGDDGRGRGRRGRFADGPVDDPADPPRRSGVTDVWTAVRGSRDPGPVRRVGGETDRSHCKLAHRGSSRAGCGCHRRRCAGCFTLPTST